MARRHVARSCIVCALVACCQRFDACDHTHHPGLFQHRVTPSCARLCERSAGAVLQQWKQATSAAATRARCAQHMSDMRSHALTASSFARWRGHVRWCARVHDLYQRAAARRSAQVLRHAFRTWVAGTSDARGRLRAADAMRRVVARRQLQRCVAAWSETAREIRAHRCDLD